MKDYCLELAAKQAGFNAKLNVMREYLQAYALKALYDAGFFRSAAFVGGTALRFLYGLPRFSEGLDFSLEKIEKGYRFAATAKKLKDEFTLAGYSIAVTLREEKTVQEALLKFDGLMYEAGISSQKSQRLSIKIEVDSNPPKGAGLRADIVNKYFPVSFLSYDIPSLFAGKIHALFSRDFTKGRDFFDLGWYLSRWKGIIPNITLLSNALKQTGWSRQMPTEGNWRDLLYKAVSKADWEKVKNDVQNFLEDERDLAVFTKENTLNLIRQ